MKKLPFLLISESVGPLSYSYVVQKRWLLTHSVELINVSLTPLLTHDNTEIRRQTDMVPKSPWFEHYETVISCTCIYIYMYPFNLTMLSLTQNVASNVKWTVEMINWHEHYAGILLFFRGGGVSFQDRPRKVKIMEWLKLSPKIQGLVFCSVFFFLQKNCDGETFLFSHSTPWTWCGMTRTLASTVEQCWWSYPLKGTKWWVCILGASPRICETAEYEPAKSEELKYLEKLKKITKNISQYHWVYGQRLSVQ
jgi:hypothetical protein